MKLWLFEKKVRIILNNYFSVQSVSSSTLLSCKTAKGSSLGRCERGQGIIFIPARQSWIDVTPHNMVYFWLFALGLTIFCEIGQIYFTEGNLYIPKMTQNGQNCLKWSIFKSKASFVISFGHWFQNWFQISIIFTKSDIIGVPKIAIFGIFEYPKITFGKKTKQKNNLK